MNACGLVMTDWAFCTFPASTLLLCHLIREPFWGKSLTHSIWNTYYLRRMWKWSETWQDRSRIFSGIRKMLRWNYAIYIHFVLFGKKAIKCMCVAWSNNKWSRKKLEVYSNFMDRFFFFLHFHVFLIWEFIICFYNE